MKVWIAQWWEEIIAVATTEELARSTAVEQGFNNSSVEEWEVLDGVATE
jgi:hypothetical protein